MYTNVCKSCSFAYSTTKLHRTSRISQVISLKSRCTCDVFRKRVWIEPGRTASFAQSKW